MDPYKELRDLSSKLNLIFEPQDWGIINSSSSRTIEFIMFYENSIMSEHLKYDFFELIIASYNDLILDNPKSIEKTRIVFKNFIVKYSDHEPMKIALSYWKNLEGPEFPVSQYLKE